MTLDDLLDELLFYQEGYFQNLVVRVNNKEYKIISVHSECDSVVDPKNPDLREDCNPKVVFEVKE